MNDLKHTSQIVKAILEQDKRTRNSDSFLYLKVLRHFAKKTGIPVHDMSVQVFLLNMESFNVPGFETVRRSRQKIQAMNPHLAACDNVKQMRRENEAAYYAFAVGDSE